MANYTRGVLKATNEIEAKVKTTRKKQGICGGEEESAQEKSRT